MNGMGWLYIAAAAQIAYMLAVWLRLPQAGYLQWIVGGAVLMGTTVRSIRKWRDYRALKARHRAHEREIMALLDPR